MFLLIASTLLVLIITLGYKFLQNKYSYWEKRGIPYEQPKWPVGNLQGVGRTLHFYELNQRIYQRFKNIAPFAGMYYYLRRVAFIMDLDLVKHVLIKDFASFHDRGLYSNVKDDPLTGHLITLEGAEWRAMRQKLTPVFTANRMRFMFPTVVAVAENLAQECGRLAALNIEGDVEFKDLSARYTTDVIGTCAFGLECNSLQDPNAEFRRRGRDFFENPRLSKFGRIFITSNPRLARKLGMKIFPDSVSSFFLQSVRDTIDYRQRHQIKRNDFMDLMIELKARDEAAVQANNGIDLSQGLTLEQIAAQAFVFFIAGFDTSATTMSFCLYELAKNQEVQDRLRSEIRTVLADHNNRLTYDALIAMSYLDQVFDETLRLHPTAASLIRKTTVDYQLPDSPHILEKGTTVIIPVDAIHHDPELYPSPELFQPERFTKAAKEERHPCAYLPFGDGPRNCIGLRFGKMQSKIGLVLLLKDYKVSRSSLTEDPIEIAKNQLVITAKNGVHLRVERV